MCVSHGAIKHLDRSSVLGTFCEPTGFGRFHPGSPCKHEMCPSMFEAYKHWTVPETALHLQTQQKHTHKYGTQKYSPTKSKQPTSFNRFTPFPPNPFSSLVFPKNKKSSTSSLLSNFTFKVSNIFSKSCRTISPSSKRPSNSAARRDHVRRSKSYLGGYKFGPCRPHRGSPR